MRLNLLKTTLLQVFLIIGTLNSFSQNAILAGNMEDSTAWEQVVIAEGVGHSFMFNYTEDLPAGGSGGCLRIQGTSAAGDDINLAIQQKVTLKKLTNYTFDLKFKDKSADLKNFWFEVYLNDTALIAGQDIGGTFFSSLNTWSGCGKDVDGLFSENACSIGSQGKPLSSFGTTAGDTTLWLIIKMGTYDAPANPFDVLIDDVVIKESEIIDAIPEQKALDMIIYPNPVSTILKVETQHGASIYVLDLSGKVLLRKTVVNPSETIDLSEFKRGVYILRAETEDKLVTKKIIKL